MVLLHGYPVHGVDGGQGWCWPCMEKPELGHAWWRSHKIPRETQISPRLTPERSTSHGREHGGEVGEILSVTDSQRPAKAQESAFHQMFR